MIIAVCSPSIFDSPISDRLIKKVENATLDKSWIPQTDHQRRLKFEREKLKEAQRQHNRTVDSSRVESYKLRVFQLSLGCTNVRFLKIKCRPKVIKNKISVVLYITQFPPKNILLAEQILQ